jgi:hypothetical protein
MVSKALHVNPIKTAKVACIVQPDADFANIVQGAASQSQRLFNANKDLACLCLNATRDDFPLVVGGHLSRYEHKVTRTRGGGQGACQAI